MLYHISYYFEDSKRNEYLNEAHFKSDIECYQFAKTKKVQKGAKGFSIFRKTSRGWKTIVSEN